MARKFAGPISLFPNQHNDVKSFQAVQTREASHNTPYDLPAYHHHRFFDTDNRWAQHQFKARSIEPQPADWRVAASHRTTYGRYR